MCGIGISTVCEIRCALPKRCAYSNAKWTNKYVVYIIWTRNFGFETNRFQWSFGLICWIYVNTKNGKMDSWFLTIRQIVYLTWRIYVQSMAVKTKPNIWLITKKYHDFGWMSCDLAESFQDDSLSINSKVFLFLIKPLMQFADQ